MSELKVTSSPWAFTNGIVTKRCNYSGLLDDAAAHVLEVVIGSSRSGYTGLLEPSFKMVLKPDPLLDANVLETIVGRLEVPGSAFVAPEVPIKVDHTDDPALIMTTTTVLDAETFVELISSGQDMQFVLTDHQGPVLILPIPNEPGVIEVLREALD